VLGRLYRSIHSAFGQKPGYACRSPCSHSRQVSAWRHRTHRTTAAHFALEDEAIAGGPAGISLGQHFTELAQPTVDTFRIAIATSVARKQPENA
jgi:hypothetical protein